MEAIFERIEKLRFPKPIYRDGIICNSDFIGNPNGKRVLFMTKEPNAKNHESAHNNSFIEEWNTIKPAYPFANRIAEWAYGIINDFPVYDEAKEKAMNDYYLRKVAFINYKKTRGKGDSNQAEFSELAKNVTYNQIIRDQIDTINPDIIILGLSFWDGVIGNLFPVMIGTWKNSGYGIISLGKYNNAKVINFYHPSSRNAPAASYCLLEKVVKSNAFLGL